MKVLVWRAYGDTSVYDVSTAEKLLAQIETIIECVKDWGIEGTVDLVVKHIAKHPGDVKELRRAFNTLKNAIGEGNDQFDELSIVDLQ
jgi:hypothetical protein